MTVLSRFFGRGLSCTQLEAVLQQYLDNELSPRDVPKVLRHLEECRHCGLEASLYERIKHSLHTHQDSPDDASMARVRAFATELASSGPPDAD
jgi:anti-sigma factor RsiW